MALSYFRRFYLKKTVLDYNPEKILAASIFIAYKVGQVDTNLDMMNMKFKHVSAEELLDHEFSILFIINYDTYVYCPYKALIGLSTMIQVIINRN